MDVSELDYHLPPELIAQHPAERRDESRLLVYDRASGDVRHRRFFELPRELRDEVVVVNDTRVVPARLKMRRETGGATEVLLVERLEGDVWEGLARPSRRLRPRQRPRRPRGGRGAGSGGGGAGRGGGRGGRPPRPPRGGGAGGAIPPFPPYIA